MNTEILGKDSYKPFPVMETHFPDCKIHTMPQRSPEWFDVRKYKLTASAVGAWLGEEKTCRLENAEIETLLDMASINYPKRSKKADLLELLDLVTDIPLTNSKGAIDARHNAICSILGSMSGCQVPDEWEIVGIPEGYEERMYRAAKQLSDAMDGGSVGDVRDSQWLYDAELATFPPPPRSANAWAVWNGIRMEPIARWEFEKWSGTTLLQVGFCEHKSGVAGCSPDGLLEGESIGFEGKSPLPKQHVKYLLDGKLPDIYRDQIHFSMAVTGASAWWFQSYCQGLTAFRIITERDDYTERMVEGIEEFKEHLQAAKDEIASLWDQEFNA